MKYIIYKTTNTVNKKIYIGAHVTNDENDGYIGSGLALRRAIKKYGYESFCKEILYIFDNINDMFAKEAEIVNENFISRLDTYNIKLGGQGGWDYINSSGKNLYGKNGQVGYGGENLKKCRSKEQRIEDGSWNLRNQKISEKLKADFSTGKRSPGFLGKQHTPETIQKMCGKSHQKGTGNSQFGTCWMSHPELGNKKVKAADIDAYYHLGYRKGRKIKG